MKPLRFTLSAAILVALTSCSAFPQSPDPPPDYTIQDTRESDLRSADLQGMEFTIESVSLHNDEYLGENPSDHKYFFVIKYNLKNNSDSVRSFNPQHIILSTQSGGKYPPPKYLYRNFQGYSDTIRDIEVGESVDSTIVFALPDFTIPDVLFIRGLAPGHGSLIDIPNPPNREST